MKAFSTLVVAGCLLGTAPMAQACDAKHHGMHQEACAYDMDKNKDGAVSKKEFETFHAARFKEMDANKDGKLTADEMETQHRPMRGIDQDPFDKRFDEVDINRDGGLSKDEAEIGMPMLFKRFDEIDANKDGKMTKEEVVESMKRMHENMPRRQGEGMGKPGTK